MSQTTQPTDPQEETPAAQPGADPALKPSNVESTEPTVVAAAEGESTIGTGTSMALGCIAGTVVLIIFGLLFLAISTLV